VGAVVLDANVIIALLLRSDALHADAVRLMSPAVLAGSALLTPVSVYSEILVGPIRTGTAHVVEGFLSDNGVTIISVDRDIARIAAEFRAQHACLRLPNALVLATALEHKAMVLTFDERTRRIADEI
jgi:predicted nucleic acid-binding protein